MKSPSPSITLAGKHLRRYARDVTSEQWKVDHDRASQVWTLEHFLRNGIWLYDSIIALDESIRQDFLEFGECAEAQGFRDRCRELVKQWLVPCESIEAVVSAFVKEGYVVEDADAFRARHAEAKWILAPASEAFRSDAIAKLESGAIEALRAGSVEPMFDDEA